MRHRAALVYEYNHMYLEDIWVLDPFIKEEVESYPLVSHFVMSYWLCLQYQTWVLSYWVGFMSNQTAIDYVQYEYHSWTVEHILSDVQY